MFGLEALNVITVKTVAFDYGLCYHSANVISYGQSDHHMKTAARACSSAHQHFFDHNNFCKCLPRLLHKQTNKKSDVYNKKWSLLAKIRFCFLKKLPANLFCPTYISLINKKAALLYLQYQMSFHSFAIACTT